MPSLILAAVAFLLLHLLVSGTTVRDRLVARLGEGRYLGLFSLASGAVLAWMFVAHRLARGEAADLAWWGVTPVTRSLQIGLMLLAFLLIVPGVLTRNPGAVGQSGAVDDPDPVRGVLRITRHPFLWGMAIWSAGHILVNGDLASLVLFGSLLVLSLAGAASIDAKRRRTHGERWAAFEARSSFVPFAAILAGQQSLRLGEIGWWRILAAVVVYIGVATVHGGVVFGGL